MRRIIESYLLIVILEFIRASSLASVHLFTLLVLGTGRVISLALSLLKIQKGCGLLALSLAKVFSPTSLGSICSHYSSPFGNCIWIFSKNGFASVSQLSCYQTVLLRRKKLASGISRFSITELIS